MKSGPFGVNLVIDDQPKYVTGEDGQVDAGLLFFGTTSAVMQLSKTSPCPGEMVKAIVDDCRTCTDCGSCNDPKSCCDYSWSYEIIDGDATVSIVDDPNDNPNDALCRKAIIIEDGSGNVDIIARRDGTDVEVRGRLTIGCGGGCRGGSCPVGTGDAKVGSVDFSIALGRTHTGESAGVLRIYGKEPSLLLSDPLGLTYNMQCRRDGIFTSADAITVSTLYDQPVYCQPGYFDPNDPNGPDPNDPNTWDPNSCGSNYGHDPNLDGMDTGVVDQIRTRSMLLDVVDDDPNDDAYLIHLFRIEDVSDPNKESAPWSANPADAFASWEIAATEDTAYHLTITGYVNGVATREYEYTYTGDPNDPNEGYAWQLQTRDANDVLVRTESQDNTAPDPIDGTWTRTRTIQQDGGTWRKTEETLTNAYGADRILERVEDPNGEALTTSYGYYDSGNLAGQRKYVVYPDGSWEFCTYDYLGRIRSTFSTWNDSWPAGGLTAVSDPNTLRSIARETRYTYVCDDPNDPNAPCGAMGHYPKTLTEIIAGETISVTRYTYGYSCEWANCYPMSDIFYDYTIERRYADLGTLSNPLTTKTYYYADTDREKIYKVKYPDGRVDMYEYDQGSYSQGDPNSPGTFSTETDGDYERTRISHGLDGNTDNNPFVAVAGKTTRDIRLTDAAGRLVLEETEVYDGSSYERISWQVYQYDELGRLSATYYSDGTYETRTPSDCCGLESSTDRQGIETEYEQDILGRTRVQTYVDGGGNVGSENDIVTTIAYSVSSSPNRRVVTTTVSDGGSSLATVSQYDLAGRVRSQVDAAQLETTYAYDDSYDDSDGRSVTVTRPDGTTEVTEYYRDGHTKSVTTAGILQNTYVYGVDTTNDMLYRIEYTGPDGDQSERWRKTLYDALGRVKKVIRPGFDVTSNDPNVVTEYSYNSVGQLEVVETTAGGVAVQAPTVYEYDDLNNVIRRGLDLNGDDDLDRGGTDRITQSETEYVEDPNDSTWWRRTRTSVYLDGQSDPSTVSVRRERLTGFAGGVIRESQSRDAKGNWTINKVLLDRTSQALREIADFPYTTSDPNSVTLNGRLRLSTDAAGVKTNYGYDGLGRRTTVTDGRGNVTTTVYDSDGRVQAFTASMPDSGTETTTIDYFGSAEDHPGQIKWVQNAAGEKTYYDYDDFGNKTFVWGSVPQPVFMRYDAFGDRVQLSTFRNTDPNWASPSWPGGDPNDANKADITTWDYDEGTGLLVEKTYADGKSVTYDYTDGGRLYTRTWARLDAGSSPIVTTYHYDLNTADPNAIVYSDGTTNVLLNHTRDGRLSEVTDATGTRTLSYTAYLELETENLPDAFFGSSRDVKRLYTSDAVGRLNGLEIGTSGAEYDADYFYAAASGRLERVTGPGLPSSGTNPGATYTYLANTHLVDELEFVDNGSAIAEVDYGYESERPLLTSVENKWLTGPVTVSKYQYVNDSLGRRTSCVRTGTAFTGGSSDHFDLWSYNDRNELTGSKRYAGTDINVLTVPNVDEDHTYTYDPIGNRTEYEKGDDDPTYGYAANDLNQYTMAAVPGAEATGQRFVHDADGNLIETYVAADLDQDGDVDLADLQALLAANGSYVGDLNYNPNADFNADGYVGLADLQGLLSLYNQTTQGADLVWDAENRLVSWTPKAPLAGDQKVTFKYDYLSRRVEKKVYDWDTGDPNDPNDDAWETNPTDWRKFVWYNWLMLEELECDPTDGSIEGVIRKYTWGKDLSGSLEDAGGIGGLLATHDVDGSEDYLYFYDANGNVGQLIAASDGSIEAKYEYDPYGNVIASDGDYAEENPFRFSTKYWDDETGFGYWGHRYYDPTVGRWLSRDPIEELGGDNLYCAFLNDPIGLSDPVGKDPVTGYASREYGHSCPIECESSGVDFELDPAGAIMSRLPWLKSIIDGLPKAKVRIGGKFQTCRVCCGDEPGRMGEVSGYVLHAEVTGRKGPNGTWIAAAGWTGMWSVGGSVSRVDDQCKGLDKVSGCITGRLCAGVSARLGPDTGVGIKSIGECCVSLRLCGGIGFGAYPAAGPYGSATVCISCRVNTRIRLWRFRFGAGRETSKCIDLW